MLVQLNQQWLNVDDEPMWIYCWATGYEAGPPLAHRVLFAGQT